MPEERRFYYTETQVKQCFECRNLYKCSPPWKDYAWYCNLSKELLTDEEVRSGFGGSCPLPVVND